jgi:hypothetical protein
MSEAERILLEDARNTLLRAVRKVEGLGDLREAFAGWALRESVPSVLIEGACRAAVDRPVAQKSYRDVAVLGFAADAWRANFAHRDLLVQRLEWLAGRNPNLGGSPAGFCSDPIALLGVALGAQAIGCGALTGGIAAWLDGFSGASFNSQRVPGRDKLFAAAALRSVGAKVVIDVADTDEISDVRVTLRARGLLPPVHKVTDEAEAASALRLVLGSPADLDPLVAAVRLAALGHVKDAVRSRAVSSLDPLTSAVPGGDAPITAFISYAWEEDPEHNEDVLALAHRLRHMGVDAVIDRYVDGTPDEGWPIWMIHQVQRADFVIVVCTDRYRRRCEREEGTGVGKGAKWEGAVITQSIYENDSNNRKFVPVFLNSADMPHVPLMLKSATRYDLSNPQQFDKLYRYLTGQPQVVAPPVGRRIELKPHDVKPFKPGA